MNSEQLIAIIAAPVIFVVMTPVFKILFRKYGKKQWGGKNLAWYSGMAVYWLSWCLVFPFLVPGFREISAFLVPGKINIIQIIVLSLPVLITFSGRFFMKFEKADDAKEAAVLASTAVINGALEELLWRGVFIVLFPGNIFWGFVWPTVFFAVWHLAPGSISAFSKWTLAAGALVFGACWGFAAFSTGTVFWTIISHILTGLTRILNVKQPE